jgi:hypothetical protein
MPSKPKLTPPPTLADIIRCSRLPELPIDEGWQSITEIAEGTGMSYRGARLMAQRMVANGKAEQAWFLSPKNNAPAQFYRPKVH